MNDFQTYVTDYGQLHDCPDPLTLSELQAKTLDPFTTRRLENHLAECPACQATLAALEDLPAELWEPELPNTLPELSELAPLEHSSTQAVEPAVGQVWLLKAEVDFNQHALPLPAGQPQVLETGLLNLVVITHVGKRHLGKAAFQELEVCPVSEEWLMASEWDLVLETPTLQSLGPCMIEVWNAQTLLALQLDQSLGQLSEQEQTDLDTLAQAWSQKVPVTNSRLPRGGTVVHPTGAHQAFQQIDREQASRLALPFQALQQGLKDLRPALAEVARGRLKASAASDKLPAWLNPPQRYSQTQSKAPVLAASSNQDTVTTDAPGNPKECFRLTDELLLEMWVEGDNLEFYCRREHGDDLEGLAIWYADRDGIQRQIITDEFGTSFLTLDTLPLNEPLLLEIVWQQQSWHYPFIYQGRS